MSDQQLFATPFSKIYWRCAFNELKNTRMLVFASLIIALRVAFKLFAIPIGPSLNITTGFFVNALGSMCYGPVVALISGAISDTIGCILFPQGIYFFPFIFVDLKDFKVQAADNLNKKFCSLVFELTCMKNSENKPVELFQMQELLSSALLPVIEFGNKKIALDNVVFMVNNKTLIMTFGLNFYTNKEETEYELMQKLDFSIKENKNAR